MREHLILYDTTLRDGGLTPGVKFTASDKRQVTALIDALGIDYIEGGWPGANQTDIDLFAEPPSTRATFTAFGMTKRADRSIENDPVFRDVLNADVRAICLVGKTWDFHVRVALQTDLENNLDAIRHSIRAIVDSGKEALFDCEHFFDGFANNRAYALECAKAAHEAGARWIVLCDTNGGALPSAVYDTVSATSDVIPSSKIGIHTHNDGGLALANSLAAVDAGARQIQGTLNGLGERCGNADLLALIPTLKLKKSYSERFTISVSDESMANLTSYSNKFDGIINQNPLARAPYVGAHAFMHKAGLHASAIVKNTSTYEHIKPERVGNTTSLLVSDQSGRANLIAALEKIGLKVSRDDPQLERLIEIVKQREAEGYAYEDAPTSFALLARRVLGSIPDFFHVERFRVAIERLNHEADAFKTYTDAFVKVRIGDDTIMSAAEGNGPVHALDKALRKDLGLYQNHIKGLEVQDFKVRILNEGTEAITRVVVECRDENGMTWRTVGVSPNIVEASFQALHDALIAKLLHSECKPATS